MITFFPAGAQTGLIDTVPSLTEVTVQAFGQRANMATATVTTINYVPHSNKTSLLTDINTIPGVRMEERSPGSYRINIRGSSLRSPFGVRNVKVYWNDIPLTDPGGSTYFNQLAFNNFSTLEVVKGPVSSMYGAGTGGLIVTKNAVAGNNGVSLEYITGSYNLQTVLASAGWHREKLGSEVTYAHNQSNGYRQQSAMRRDNFSWTGHIKLSLRRHLSMSVLYTDMYYQTPGALTLAEYKKNPKAARPSAGIYPSAVDAKAAIFQRNLTGGITYKDSFNTLFSNITTVYGSYNHIKNSAVRNYETRNEPHFGGRSVFTFDKKLSGGHTINWNTGAEVQSGRFNIHVSGNKSGVPDTLQTNDNVSTVIYSLFTQASFTGWSDWVYTAGMSYNKSKIDFHRLSDVPALNQPIAFTSQLAPRFSVSKAFRGSFSFLAVAAKGYAPPTIAELLPSTGMINSALGAEAGWNYELTLKKQIFRNVWLEATGFHFDLKNALVQRRDESGADYFTNAGNIKQKGAELFASCNFRDRTARLLHYGYVRAGYTYSHFRYGHFVKEENDFSGKWLPGVPSHTVSVLADIQFRKGFYLNSTYYRASSVFLDDANTAVAKAYHLLTAKLGYGFSVNKIRLNVYTGADNLLNETYSLGNDINAAAGRYYNAAPVRNYYVGAAINL
ncbi:TonB-dependent receptor [Niabella aquatica]